MAGVLAAEKVDSRDKRSVRHRSRIGADHMTAESPRPRAGDRGALLAGGVPWVTLDRRRHLGIACCGGDAGDGLSAIRHPGYPAGRRWPEHDGGEAEQQDQARSENHLLLHDQHSTGGLEGLGHEGAGYPSGERCGSGQGSERRQEGFAPAPVTRIELTPQAFEPAPHAGAHRLRRHAQPPGDLPRRENIGSRKLLPRHASRWLVHAVGRSAVWVCQGRLERRSPRRTRTCAGRRELFPGLAANRGLRIGRQRSPPGHSRACRPGQRP